MEAGCTEEEIRVAFRQLALAVHPDKNREPRAGEAFAKVQQVTKVKNIFQPCGQLLSTLESINKWI